MGIVQRQAFKGSVVNGIGIVLGFLATIYIYPRFTDGKGFLDYIISLVGLLIPFANAGLSSVLTRFYPYFQTQEGEFEEFKGYILFRFFVRYLLFVVVLFFTVNWVGDWLVNWNVDTQGLFTKYYWVVVIILGIELSNNYLERLAMINRRIVVPELLRRTSQKIFYPLIILLGLQFNLTYNQMSWMLIGYYVLVLIGLYIYNQNNGFLSVQWTRTLPKGEIHKREIDDYSLFSSLNSISSVLVSKLDRVLVSSILGFSQGGIYGIIGFMANVVILPYRPIVNITTPLLSEKIKNNKWDEVDQIYKKTSLVSYTFGLVVFLFLWFDMDSMLSLTKYSEKLLVSKNIFLALGLAKLFDLVTSVNGTILQMSKDYRYNLFFLIFLGLCNVILTYQFIHVYGAVGAAYATMIAIFLYNVIKLLFLYFRYDLNPLTWSTVIVTLLGIAALVLLHFLPDLPFSNRYVNFLVTSMIIGMIILIVVIIPTYSLRLSEDFNQLVKQWLDKLSK